MSGLVLLPLIAQFSMLRGGWPAGWIGVGTAVLIVCFVPTWLFIVPRPEDIGLSPDRLSTTRTIRPAEPEPHFNRAQALRTRSFWMLSLFALFAYPVQAGVSL